MPYLASLNSRQRSGHGRHIGDSSQISSLGILLEWAWPTRCYRVTAPPSDFKQCKEVWILIDGYPAISGAGLRSREFADFSQNGSVLSGPASSIPTLPENLSDVMDCFTAVLVAPHEGIIRAQRDWLGGRSAYWVKRGATISISTSSSILTRFLDSGSIEDPHYIATMFAGRSPLPGHSSFKEIRELLPGHIIDFRSGGIDSKQLDRGIFDERAAPNSPVEQFLETFGKAVENASTTGSEETAIMLSGGMDSGSVAAMASSQADSAGTRPRVVSWKLSDFPDADESRWIEAVADFLGLERELFEASALLPFSSFDTAHVTTDYPVYNAFRPMILETYRNASRLGARVILNASGGDLSYPHFSWVLHDQLARLDLPGAIRTLSGLVSLNRSRALFARRNLRYLAGRLVRGKSMPPLSPPAWLTEDAAQHHGLYPRLLEESSRFPHPQYADNLLTSAHGTAHENAFSNRYGLDRRDPFQNPRLVALMLRLPFSFSHREGSDKWIMREAMRDRLPEEIRLKGRTGLLTSFFDAGFERNKGRIAEFLLTGNRQWESWVKRHYVEDALSADVTSTRDQLVVSRCIGYALWRQAIDDGNANGPR